MYFRFRRSMHIAQGVRINLNKGEPSLSIGPTGAHLTLSSAGISADTGIPGSGTSVREKLLSFNNSSSLASNEPFWEFKLLQAGIGTILAEGEADYDDLQQSGLDPATFAKWVGFKTDELSAITEKLVQTLGGAMLKEALGPPGKAGDREKLISVVESVECIMDAIIEWEREISAYRWHPIYSEVANAAGGLSRPLLESIKSFKGKLDDQLPFLIKGGSLDLSFQVAAPSSADELIKALTRLGQANWTGWKQMLTARYKIARADAILGEFSIRDIRSNIVDGYFKDTDWYWSAKDNDWKALAELVQQ